MNRRRSLLVLLSIALAAPAWATSPLWTRLDPPPAREGQTLTFDPVGQRLLLFGGQPDASDFRSGLNDLWEYHLPTDAAWHPIAPTGTPPSPVYGHSTIYDPVRNRLIVFGGMVGGDPKSELMALDLSATTPQWITLDCCAPPPARFGHGAVYDPAGDRMIVFAGFGALGQQLNDLWSYSLAGGTWTHLSPAGTPPSARRSFTMELDPSRNRVLVFGGLGSGPTNDLWALDLSGSMAWSPLAAQGTTPQARFGQVSTWDAAGDRLLVMGGGGSQNFGDAWELDVTGTPTWAQLAPAGSPPLARYLHAAALDPVAHRWFIQGGTVNTVQRDLWTLSLDAAPTWARLGPGSGFPSNRVGPAMILDGPRSRLIVFGGQNMNGNNSINLGDAWSIPLATPQAAESLVAGGTPPAPMYSPTSIYDPVREQMVMVGWTGGTTDVWSLSLNGAPSWSHWTPTGQIPERKTAPSCIYDPVRDRMLMIGGSGPSGVTEVWALSLTGTPTWTRLQPAGPTPPQFYFASAIYDPATDRVVVYVADQLWLLGLTTTPTWQPVSPSPIPASRNAHVAIRRENSGEMFVFSGDLASGPDTNDLWTLQLSGGYGWTPDAPAGGPPPVRASAAAVYDADGDRMLVFGGRTADFLTSQSLDDLWSLSWSAPLSVGPPSHGNAALAIDPAYPNPTRADIRFAFRISAPGDVVIRIHDIAGRSVRSLFLPGVAAGSRVATWDGRTDAGLPVSPGLYTFSVSAGGATRSGRVVVLHP